MDAELNGMDMWKGGRIDELLDDMGSESNAAAW